MSGLADGPRLYQQEAAIRAASAPLEDIMTKSHLPQVVAAFAAAITTLVLFGSVASLANEDKAALAAAHAKAPVMAQNRPPTTLIAACQSRRPRRWHRKARTPSRAARLTTVARLGYDLGGGVIRCSRRSDERPLTMITNGIIQRELTAADWHRLNGLLAEALDLEGEARTAWLAALPAEAADLQPLLAQLLVDADSTRFDGTSQTLRPVVAMAAAAMAGMRHEATGDRIGPWRLERLVAEGGMGAVWVAQRADGVMQRRAALKLPRAEWVDRGLSERIARERAILARLQHPAIAVLYDAGLRPKAGRISRSSTSMACRSMPGARAAS